MSSRGKRRRFALSQMRITRGALYLLFAEVGMSLVFLLSEDDAKLRLVEWLTANASQLWHDFKVWTLVSSPILQLDFIGLVFDVLLLWMFLPALERLWGTRKFLLFALWTSLAAVIAGTLFGALVGDPAALGEADQFQYILDGGRAAFYAPIDGLDPFIYGCFVAYGVLYADHPVSFFGVLPMTGKQLMYGIIGFVSLFVIIGQQWVAGVGYAAAMLLAWLLTSGRWNPRLWYLRWKHKRLRRHLKVVRDDDDPDTWIN